MDYALPKKIRIGNYDYKIRTDFRLVLDIITALNDVELTFQDKAWVTMQLLYKDYKKIPPQNLQEAFEKAFVFINCGEYETKSNDVKLIDWEQDFKYIVAPINRTLGFECRNSRYLHWWTFISAYMEIGECVLSSIASIRNKKIRGKKLNEEEQEFYNRNKNIIDLRKKLSHEEKIEQELIEQKKIEHNQMIKEIKAQRLIRT